MHKFIDTIKNSAVGQATTKAVLIWWIASQLLTSCWDNKRDIKSEQLEHIKSTYRYGIVHFVPDSLQNKKAERITKTVSAASYHMTGWDYEDPEDLINAVSNQADELFSKPVEGLYFDPKHDWYMDTNNFYWELSLWGWDVEFIPYEKLTPEQKEIFKQLKK